MRCRHCQSTLNHKVLDLGLTPPSNAYLTSEDIHRPSTFFPLRVLVCDHCWLMQTEDYAAADQLFTPNYAYFSSTSSSWLRHAHLFVEQTIARLELDASRFVIEVASNDGYLLRNFVAAGIPCLGIEPTRSTAEAASLIGIPVCQEFFGEKLASRLADNRQQADLIVGNNVYAHVPDINDFTRGLQTALKPEGVISLEFPHVQELLAQGQFDTIYHEHYSYLSLHTVQTIFHHAGLRVWDVEILPTHGGSLRVWGCHAAASRVESPSVANLLLRERSSGLLNIQTYMQLQNQADQAKNALLAFLIRQKQLGKKVMAYGAAAKGNTLINYAGIKADLLPLVCDTAPSKQGKYLPGSLIRIGTPDDIDLYKPDHIWVTPWNLTEEIKELLKRTKKWGCNLVIAIPSLKSI